MMHKNLKQTKLCPLLDRDCEKHICAIYNEKFDRCDIGLLAYNAYLLASAIKQQNPNLK
jgi:hypothetical protein